jgi:diguanylate cyclase (GGDEF)-like protein
MSNQLPDNFVNVLIIDDDLEYAEMLQDVFSKIEIGQFKSTHFDRLTKAMSYLEREKPDVILLDLSLPDSSPQDTFFTVHDKIPHIPIVVVTGHTDRSLAINAVREGAQDYIIKGDFDFNQLARAMLYAIERHQARSLLEQLSFEDELTGLLNRRGFVTLAPQNIKIAQRANWEILLIFADLDGLKSINDSYGHQEGDKAIKEAAKILKDTFRTSDLIARIGGDEFSVLAINASRDGIETITNRLNANIARHNQPDRDYPLSISFGIERFDANSDMPLNEMLQQADQALYKKKNSKRGSMMEN